MNDLNLSTDLFLPEEHAILSAWFKTAPVVDYPLPTVDEALERMGLSELDVHEYSELDAAVAFIILESVENRLPQWAVFYENGEYAFSRGYRDKNAIPDRTVIIVPRYLMTINWADSGPGCSWPVDYYVTWLPQYDRFVVTASADGPDAFDYPDFAIGFFGKEKSVLDGAREVITNDWRHQYDTWDQSPWAYLFGTGLVSEEEAQNWAHSVWPEGSFDFCNY